MFRNSRLTDTTGPHIQLILDQPNEPITNHKVEMLVHKFKDTHQMQSLVGNRNLI